MPLSAAQDYPLWLNLLIFAGAAAIVWIGGAKLTLTLDAISIKTGLGQAVVGMLLLGGITSLPEVANVVTASSAGNPALAVNNLLGSAAINVLLLAIVDAFVGRDALTSVVARPSTLMMGTLCLLVLVVVAAAITIGDAGLFGVGAWSAAICLMSVGAFWLSANYGQRAPWQLDNPPDREDADQGADPAAGQSLRRLIIKSAVAGAAIFLAGYALSQTGDALAEQTGLGSSMVGFALIGVSTSLPELSSTSTAIRLRRYEMAFGQVLGTNFINLSLILLADVFFTGGLVLNELGRFEIISSLLGATLIGIFLVGLLEHRNLTVLRMGYDSFAVIVLFVAGMALLSSVG